MSIDRQEMLDFVCRTAVVAGEAILKIYAEEFDVRHKTDKTPVTEADLAAERIIVDRLMSAFPDIPCVAEELCESEGTPPCCDRFWAIDPLDGTPSDSHNSSAMQGMSGKADISRSTMIRSAARSASVTGVLSVL